MKTLRVNDLLIVELENRHQLAGVSNNGLWYYDELMTKDDYPISYTFDFNIELICKGSELTEEIAKEFIKTSIHTGLHAHYVKNVEVNTYCYNSALDSFKSLIKSQGYYWGENPIKVHTWASENADVYLAQWKEAKQKTFNLEQTLIFKIVE